MISCQLRPSKFPLRRPGPLKANPWTGPDGSGAPRGFRGDARPKRAPPFSIHLPDEALECLPLRPNLCSPFFPSPSGSLAPLLLCLFRSLPLFLALLRAPLRKVSSPIPSYQFPCRLFPPPPRFSPPFLSSALRLYFPRHSRNHGRTAERVRKRSRCPRSIPHSIPQSGTGAVEKGR